MPAANILFRRVIGPVPPRDATGRLKIEPVMGERVRLNAIKEPVRDKDGQPVMEQYDTRDPREYFGACPPGAKIQEGALKGLAIYEVDLSPPDAIPEPLVRVYARDERHAIEVYKREMGATRFTLTDPTVRKIQ